jgi:hypothetical protein
LDSAVKNSAGQDRSLGGVRRSPRVHHLLDAFQQVRKVWMPGLGAFFELRGHWFLLSFELYGYGGAVN